MMSLISPVMATLMLSALMTSCDRTRNDKGYEYFPDMSHSFAYETYSPNKNYKDRKTEHAPVPGTINREMAPYPFPANDSGRAMARSILKNPFSPVITAIDSGKVKYQIFCQNCHGIKGDGKGYLFVSKRFIVPPASYLSDRVMKMTEGEFYHVITNGYNAMGPHRSLIRPADRWKIILYVQHELQHKQ